jgi:hypothetical protein
MDSRYRIRIALELIIVVVVILLGVPATLYWKVQAPKLSSAVEQPAPAKTDTSADRPKSVLRSTLAGSWYSADPAV